MPYAPAGQTTQSAGLTHLATVWYNRKGLDQLRQMYRFQAACEPDEVPLRVGKTAQFYRYTLLAANTNPSAEGVIGNSVAQATTTVSATLSEYSDFTTLSTLLDETAIDPIVENHASNLGYRAGLTVDTLCRTEFDANAGATVATVGAYASVQDARKAVANLGAINVRPRNGDEFLGIVHPYVLYDIKSDNTAGGFIDVMKYANPQAMIEGWQAVEGEAGKVEGVRLVKSTNVGTSGTAPNVLYNWYIVGKGAVGAIALSGRGPSNVTNPAKQDFRIATVRGGQPSIYDPEGKIGAAVSYRFVFVVKTLDATNLRYKVVQADASLV